MWKKRVVHHVKILLRKDRVYVWEQAKGRKSIALQLEGRERNKHVSFAGLVSRCSSTRRVWSTLCGIPFPHACGWVWWLEQSPPWAPWSGHFRRSALEFRAKIVFRKEQNLMAQQGIVRVYFRVACGKAGGRARISADTAEWIVSKAGLGFRNRQDPQAYKQIIHFSHRGLDCKQYIFSEDKRDRVSLKLGWYTLPSSSFRIPAGCDLARETLCVLRLN